MAEGQFNIVDYIRRIGLKNVSAMPVIESIQPVSIVGENADLTPAFEAPGGFFGGILVAVVGERGMIELESRGAGGAYVEAFLVRSVVDVTAQIGPPVLTGAGTLAGQTSNETPLSVGRIGNVAAPAGDVAFLRHDVLIPVRVYVPSGQAFRVFSDVDNTALNATMWFHDVPASEHGVA